MAKKAQHTPRRRKLPPPPETALDFLTFLVAFTRAPVERLSTEPQRYYEDADVLPYDEIAVGLFALLHLEGQPEARGPRLEDSLMVLNPFSDLVPLRDRLRKLFDGIAAGSDVRVPVSLTLRIPPNHPAGQRLPTFGAKHDDELLYQTARLIEMVGAGRIRRCAASDCDQVFVKRTKGEFCSTRCQSRTYMRKLRQEEKRGVTNAKQTRTRRR